MSGPGLARATRTSVLVTLSVVLAAVPPASAHTGAAAPANSPTAAGPASTWAIDWSQEHFTPDHAGVTPYEKTLSASNVSSLVPKWVAHLPLYVQGTAVVGGVVYVSGGDASGPDKTHVYALDATDGHRLWHAVQRHGTAASLSVGAGRVFVSTLTDHSLRAFDASTGALLWRLRASGSVSKATLYSGRLFVQMTGGVVSAVDPADGVIVWQKGGLQADSLLGPAVTGGWCTPRTTRR